MPLTEEEHQAVLDKMDADHRAFIDKLDARLATRKRPIGPYPLGWDWKG